MIDLSGADCVAERDGARMGAVVRADIDDVDALSQVIADAFHDLPPSPWLIPDADSRRAVYPVYYQLYIEHAMMVGMVHTTCDRDAVALWIPVIDGQPPGPPSACAERLAMITRPWTDRFLAFDEALSSRHPLAFQHHYLAVLAVRPDRQGRGIGARLLGAHHAVLDERRMPAYVAASSPRNRAFYLRHGYTDFGAPLPLPGGPPLYAMWRQAQLQNW